MQPRRRRKQHGSFIIIAGRWFVRYWRLINENGTLTRKRVSHCLGPVEGRESKHPPRAIIEAGEDHLRSISRAKIVPERTTLTVGKFIEDVYFPLMDETRRASTSDSLRKLWKRHLDQQVIQVGSKRIRTRDLKIGDVDTYHMQAWLDAIVQTSARPLSTSVVKQAKFLLSGAFRLALQRGYRTKEKGHPVEDCSLPAGTVPAKQTHAYSADEITAMLRVLDEPARTIILLAAETGLRVGEIEGLEWPDLDGDTLRVNRSVWHNQVDNPKTLASQAPVAVSRRLRELLEMRRARDGFPTSGPIFRTSLESRLSMNNVRMREILPALNRCEVCGKAPGKTHRKEAHPYRRDETLPRWRGWHAFRRAISTDLQHSGASVAVAQGALRHSNPQVTLAHYTKVVDSAVRASLEERDNRLELGLSDSDRTVNRPSGAQPETVN